MSSFPQTCNYFFASLFILRPQGIIFLLLVRIPQSILVLYLPSPLFPLALNPQPSSSVFKVLFSVYKYVFLSPFSFSIFQVFFFLLYLILSLSPRPPSPPSPSFLSSYSYSFVPFCYPSPTLAFPSSYSSAPIFVLRRLRFLFSPFLGFL